MVLGESIEEIHNDNNILDKEKKMNNKKEIHDFNFNLQFNQMLAAQLDRVNVNMVYHKDYEKAYGELTQIFTNVNRAIQKYDSKRYDKIFILIKDTRELLREYQRSPYVKGPQRVKLRRITKSQDALVDNVYLLQGELMAVMDDMNMLFKRKDDDSYDKGKSVLQGAS